MFDESPANISQIPAEPAPVKKKAARKKAVFFNKQTETQHERNRRGWGENYDLVRKSARFKDMKEMPGDTGIRSILHSEGYNLHYTPYCAISCAYGMAEVNSISAMDRVSQMAMEYGKVFLFTCVNETLKKYARANPDKFVELIRQESWMYGKKEVPLFAAISGE